MRLLSLVIAFAAGPILAQVAPDPTLTSGVPTATFEYKLAISLPVTAPYTLPTELWARVYHPATLGSGARPLLVFLHGNHATCGRDAGAGQGRFDTNVTYTFTGTCPPGYVPVPNHEGYAYTANKLASLGYIVVSINANLGINAAPGVAGDGGLNLRRGALVLRHLQQLAAWNAAGSGHTLEGKLDFSNVGMMGHSRGGEGVRAAYNLYLDSGSPWPAAIGTPVTFKGIFEIGPVDRQTVRTLNATGIPWTVLLPMCDGDVANLQGVRPFDRMLAARAAGEPPKATFTVWGANHNFYNTEWQTSDSPGCMGHPRLFGQLIGSPEQRTTGFYAMLAFFRAHVGPGADPQYNRLFHPSYALPAPLGQVTRIDRGYSDSPSPAVTAVFEDFAGVNPENILSNVAVTYGRIANHDAVQRTARVSWNGPGADTFYQANWAGPGISLSLSGFETIEFRVSRQCKNPDDLLCQQSNLGFPADADFQIRLVDGAGNLTQAQPLSKYINLTGPVGGMTRFVSNLYHPILQTVRIPLADFGSPAALKGVRFVFDQTRRDDIFLANIRLSRVPTPVISSMAAPLLSTQDSIDAGTSEPENNRVKAARRQTSVPELGNVSGVELEFSSNRLFLPQGELLTLRIGDREFGVSRYPRSGETNTVFFLLSEEEYAALPDGAPMQIQYGSGELKGWSFGRLKK